MSEGEFGRVRRVKRDEVRSRLLKAAYEVFSERGYEGASLERVAEAAGFSKGAVYSNFSSKDELFFELVSARIDERILALNAAVKGIQKARPTRVASKGHGGDAAARRAGALLREIGEADPGWQTLFIEFWLRCARNEALRARLAEKRRDMRSRIAEAIAAQASASGLAIGRGQALDLATAILALSNGLGIEGIIDPEAVRPALMGELLARIASV
jgi:Transcriptional regulator